MSETVRYDVDGGVATITIDDGKVNALSRLTQLALDAAFDEAEAAGVPVVLTGRPGVFSAGFDLVTLRGDADGALEMVIGGFQLAVRVLSFPYPVVIACTGHAIAMGTFLLLTGDYRVGAAGDYRLAANEVAIGLTMPFAATEILRQRLSPAAFNRAVTLAETFGPANAVEAGFLDRVVAEEDLLATAHEVATMSAGLDLAAHAASKLRARAPSLAAIRHAIDDDRADLLSRV